MSFYYKRRMKYQNVRFLKAMTLSHTCDAKGDTRHADDDLDNAILSTNRIQVLMHRKLQL